MTFEPRIAAWIRSAPALEGLDVLVEDLRKDGSPLALSIARVVELLGEALVDPGVALPALAMACAALDDPKLTDKEREVARFEIETLMPVPSPAGQEAGALVSMTRGRPTLLAPDVPVDKLRRR